MNSIFINFILITSCFSAAPKYETLDELIQVHNNLISSMAKKMEEYYNKKCDDDIR